MRYSKQREEILKIVMNSCDHPDAKTIYLKTKKIISNISLGTVYRNLNTLSEERKILRIPMKDGNDRFDKTISNHNHIFCECCACVIDIDARLSDEVIKDIEEQTKFKITNCNFNIRGLCKSCQKKGKK